MSRLSSKPFLASIPRRRDMAGAHKRIKELCKRFESRWPVEAAPEAGVVGGHPVLAIRFKGRTVRLPVAGSPSDTKRDALNNERDMKRRFRELGVELRRKR